MRKAGLVVLFLSALASVASGDEVLRKKIGQMLIVGFIGPTVPDSLVADLSTQNLGGVILLSGNGNFKSLAQLQQVTGLIRGVALTPPFIALDQEGGLVARLKASDGFASTYSAYTLGTTFASVESTRVQAALMASWVQGCGFNVNFAPVADVDVNPTSPAIGALGRSFSSDPYAVAAHDQAFVDAFHARNIISTLKHFPGHGSAGADSHLTLPDITSTWTSSELIPYRSLLATASVDIVMVGHLYDAKIDSLYPTSLSRATIQGLLRDSLHYSGVVITDALNMGAITNNFGFWDAAVRSINAGTDILLYVNNMQNGASLCRQLVDTLESMVRRGSIAQSRIDESYGRIMTLKNRFHVTSAPVTLFATRTVPERYSLASFPNPFNPSTTVRFSVPAGGRVSVKVYDILGHETETLVEGYLDAGVHEIRWHAGAHASGVYLCRLLASGTVITAKLLLLK